MSAAAEFGWTSGTPQVLADAPLTAGAESTIQDLRAAVRAFPGTVVGVVLSYAASLGAAGLLFQRVLGFAAFDYSVPLMGFVFLVALGVDYNIFPMTRVREYAATLGHKQGVLAGLSGTGGVITSAGIVLARRSRCSA